MPEKKKRKVTKDFQYPDWGQDNNPNKLGIDVPVEDFYATNSPLNYNLNLMKEDNNYILKGRDTDFLRQEKNDMKPIIDVIVPDPVRRKKENSIPVNNTKSTRQVWQQINDLGYDWNKRANYRKEYENVTGKSLGTDSKDNIELLRYLKAKQNTNIPVNNNMSISEEKEEYARRNNDINSQVSVPVRVQEEVTPQLAPMGNTGTPIGYKVGKRVYRNNPETGEMDIQMRNGNFKSTESLRGGIRNMTNFGANTEQYQGQLEQKGIPVYERKDFGGWLKRNIGNIGKVAMGIGSLAMGNPGGIGMIAGGVSGAVGDSKQQDQLKAQEQQLAMQKEQQLMQQQLGQQKMAGGGNITQFEGNSHEQGGIPINNETEVEGGETKGIGKTQDFVYSDRIKIPGTKKTYAQESKRIARIYELRKNDEWSNNEKEMALNKLAEHQEQLKQQNVNKQLSKMQQMYPEQMQQAMQPMGQNVPVQQEMRYGGRYKAAGGVQDINNPPDEGQSYYKKVINPYQVPSGYSADFMQAWENDPETLKQLPKFGADKRWGQEHDNVWKNTIGNFTDKWNKNLNINSNDLSYAKFNAPGQQTDVGDVPYTINTNGTTNGGNGNILNNNGLDKSLETSLVTPLQPKGFKGKVDPNLTNAENDANTRSTLQLETPQEKLRWNGTKPEVNTNNKFGQMLKDGSGYSMMGSLFDLGRSAYRAIENKKNNFGRADYLPVTLDRVDNREQLNDINTTYAGTADQIKNVNGSLGQYLANRVGLANSQARALAQTGEHTANANTQIANEQTNRNATSAMEVSARNQQIFQQEQIANAQDRAQRGNTVQGALTNIDNLRNIRSKDKMQDATQREIAQKWLNTQNYSVMNDGSRTGSLGYNSGNGYTTSNNSDGTVTVRMPDGTVQTMSREQANTLGTQRAMGGKINRYKRLVK